MAATTPGITFSETMAGGFSLGVTDPEAGEKLGKARGEIFAIHAQVAVSNMEGFVDDPQHVGSLTGSVDFTPFGNGIQGSGPGAFNLFQPADEPGLKLMVYELPFEHDGQAYYMAGRKKVRNGKGFDLWTDTTTLYTHLHKGIDKNGEIVGAGILSLGVRDLLALLSTVKAPGAEDAAVKAKTIATFGKFFLGELWDTYVRHVPGLG